MKKTLILLLIVSQTACKETSISDKNLIDSDSPDENTQPIPNEPIDGIGEDDSSIINNPAIYTGTHGNFSVIESLNLKLPKNHELQGMTVFDDVIYLLVNNKIVTDLNEKLIVSYNNTTSFGETICNIIDDGTLGKHLLIDDNFFYIYKKTSYLTFYTYDRETCELVEEWISTTYLGTSYYRHAFAKNKQSFFAKDYDTIMSVDVNSGLLNSEISKISYAEKSLQLSSIYTLHYGSNDRLWIYESYKNIIWIINFKNEKVGWFAVDTSDYPMANNTQYIAPYGEQNLLLLANEQAYDKVNFKILNLKFSITGI